MSRMETLSNKNKPGAGEAPLAGQNMEGGEQRAQAALRASDIPWSGGGVPTCKGGRRRRKSRGSLGAVEESVSRVPCC